MSNGWENFSKRAMIANSATSVRRTRSKTRRQSRLVNKVVLTAVSNAWSQIVPNLHNNRRKQFDLCRPIDHDDFIPRFKSNVKYCFMFQPRLTAPRVWMMWLDRKISDSERSRKSQRNCTRPVRFRFDSIRFVLQNARLTLGDLVRLTHWTNVCFPWTLKLSFPA